MINARENVLRLYRNESPERFPRDADTCNMLFPGDRAGPWNKQEDKGYDWFGVHWTVCPGAGQTVTPGHPAIVSDFERWREQVQFPDPYDHDWQTEAARQCANWNRENQMGALVIAEGPFERLHSLLGFEDALTAFYDYPDELMDYMEAMREYKLTCIRIAKQYFNPDLIIVHDDWGTNKNMFFSPELWRTYLKPQIAALIDETHALGMYYEHHSCGCIEPIFGDLVELGIDSIQPLQYPANNIKAIIERCGNRFISRGGYDSQTILSENASDAQLRSSIRYSLETLTPGGRHIPYVPFIGDNSAHAIELMEDEVRKYGMEYYGCAL